MKSNQDEIPTDRKFKGKFLDKAVSSCQDC